MSEPIRYSIASKVFLLGEYAVLSGATGLIASLKPRFEMHTRPGVQHALNAGCPFPENAPIGKLYAWAVSKGCQIPTVDFVDPFEGRGGFGGSTAEFALFYAAIAELNGWRQPRWDQCWGLYRELTQVAGSMGPSGADLVGQCCGGIVAFSPKEIEVEFFDPWPSSQGNRDLSGLLIFSANRIPGAKTATHTHLEKLKDRDFTSLDLLSVIEVGCEAIRERDFVQLGQCLTSYGDSLRQRGLEADRPHLIRKKFLDLPGVLGAKGAGALQTDAMIVLLDATDEDFLAHVQAAQSLAAQEGLEFVQQGLFPEKGMTRHEILGSGAGQYRVGQIHGQTGLRA